MSSASYEERLTPPIAWWLVGAGFVATVWWIFVIATPQWLAWLAAAVALGMVVGLLGRYGSARLAVTDGELRAGRAHIPLALCGAVEPLDRDQTRRAGGTEADARAYFLLRPYIATAVRVTIDDPQDPVPYWLLSTRRPERLAAAVRTGRGVGR
ncbi:MAG: DUF3093 domain-containing protein [Nocardioidaceae bacterium]